LVEFEFETISSSYPHYGSLYIENSDLIYFKNATQVLANGQIYDLHPQWAPVHDTHTKFSVYTNDDNQDQNIIVNKGDIVCLIENPDVQIQSNFEMGRECNFESHRLEDGSFEHVSTMCNYVLTEPLNRTSTIRGGVEFPRDLSTPDCLNSIEVLNVQNGNSVGVNYTVGGNWGHFAEGNEFRIYYNNPGEDYHKSYFVKELREENLGGGIYSKGIDANSLYECSIAFVELYADENLTEIASLDRDLTTGDVWEVIANECIFSRFNYYLDSSEMQFIHNCEGVFQGWDIEWLVSNSPDFDVELFTESQNKPREGQVGFFENFTQAMITKDYSKWYNMLDDEIHAINSDAIYQKSDLNETFFENFTKALGTIEINNASRLDLAQSHLQLTQSFLPGSDSTFNWSFDLTNTADEFKIVSPLHDSILLQDRIYNSTGWGYDGKFIESSDYMILTWAAGPKTPLLLSEFLLTIVVERDDNGNLSIVGIPDYTVLVTR